MRKKHIYTYRQSKQDYRYIVDSNHYCQGIVQFASWFQERPNSLSKLGPHREKLKDKQEEQEEKNANTETQAFKVQIVERTIELFGLTWYNMV